MLKDYGKLTFFRTSECYGDCAWSYSITFKDNQNHTVKDLISEILKSRDFDWGSITFVIGDRTYHDVIEYEYGKIKKQKQEFDLFVDKHIVNIYGRGGWSLFNYTVIIQ